MTFIFICVLIILAIVVIRSATPPKQSFSVEVMDVLFSPQNDYQKGLHAKILWIAMYRAYAQGGKENEILKEYKKCAEVVFNLLIFTFPPDENNEADKEFYLSFKCFTGDGAQQDYAKALRHGEKAYNANSSALSGVASAAYLNMEEWIEDNLATSYLTGSGVQQDYAKALKWPKKSAARDCSFKSQTLLGSCYFLGMGVTQDYTEAVKWYRKASNFGFANAQCGLGLCYETGKGVTQDYAEALRLYSEAAKKGLADAQINLGAAYAAGRGVPQDYVEAYKWYILACKDSQNLGWIQQKESIQVKLTSEQIAEGQKRAKEWQEAFENKKQ